MSVMPLDGYGVLAARALDTAREDGTDTPHYQLHLLDDGRRALAHRGQRRVPAGALGAAVPRRGGLLAPGDRAARAAAARAGTRSRRAPTARTWTSSAATSSTAPGCACCRPRSQGPDNDLADLLDGWLGRAVADPAATVFAFGQRFGPEAGVADKVFGFTPANGVHDIHMNQGNAGRFAQDNGVRQDGALLVHFPAQSRWVAIFLAFQSQSWHTDDATGNSLDAPAAAATVRIVAAMVNPAGPSPEAESVLLLNASPTPVDLTGWRIADRARQTCPVPGGPLAPGETRRVPVTERVALGNGGGTVTLLDAAGLKVDGVAYTGADAQQEGWTVTF